MKKNIFFIINPISGVGRQKTIEKLIDTSLNKNLFTPEIKYTEAPKHAIELSKQAANKYDVVVAVGGDGSINEVSRGLINTNTALAILPTGSGNGLARYLKIPLNLKKAVQIINNFNIKEIDTVNINEQKFVSIAGIGFDAHISYKFADYGKRGFVSYVKLVINEFRKYKAQKYHLTIDGNQYEKNAFLISFANSSQFGNNANISPKAKIDDGLIDICFLKKFPVVAAPCLGFRLFNKTIDKSKYIEIIQGKEIKITYPQPLIAHIDGEPVEFQNELNIKINPLSLKIIIPGNRTQ